MHTNKTSRESKNSHVSLNAQVGQLQNENLAELSAVSPHKKSFVNGSQGLPNALQSGLESLSGYDMSDVRVHYNSNKPNGVNALAYAKGNDIHLAPGQEKHLGHEAWHVVQQKQGRVGNSVQKKTKSGFVDVNDNSTLELEADVMGKKALKGGNSSGLALKKGDAPSGTPMQRLIDPKTLEEVVNPKEKDEHLINLFGMIEDYHDFLNRFQISSGKSGKGLRIELAGGVGRLSEKLKKINGLGMQLKSRYPILLNLEADLDLERRALKRIIYNPFIERDLEEFGLQGLVNRIRLPSDGLYLALPKYSRSVFKKKIIDPGTLFKAGIGTGVSQIASGGAELTKPDISLEKEEGMSNDKKMKKERREELRQYTPQQYGANMASVVGRGGELLLSSKKWTKGQTTTQKGELIAGALSAGAHATQEVFEASSAMAKRKGGDSESAVLAIVSESFGGAGAFLRMVKNMFFTAKILMHDVRIQEKDFSNNQIFATFSKSLDGSIKTMKSFMSGLQGIMKAMGSAKAQAFGHVMPVFDLIINALALVTRVYQLLKDSKRMIRLKLSHQSALGRRVKKRRPVRRLPRREFYPESGLPKASAKPPMSFIEEDIAFERKIRADIALQEELMKKDATSFRLSKNRKYYDRFQASQGKITELAEMQRSRKAKSGISGRDMEATLAERDIIYVLEKRIKQSAAVITESLVGMAGGIAKLTVVGASVGMALSATSAGMKGARMGSTSLKFGVRSRAARKSSKGKKILFTMADISSSQPAKKARYRDTAMHIWTLMAEIKEKKGTRKGRRRKQQQVSLLLSSMNLQKGVMRKAHAEIELFVELVANAMKQRADFTL